MRSMFLGVWLAGAICGAGGSYGRAETPPEAGAPTLAELGHQQVALSFAIRDQAQKLENLWQDPHYTSPEIEALRKRLAALQRELEQVQSALRARVAELPAAKAEAARLESLKGAYQAVSRKIEEKNASRAPAP